MPQSIDDCRDALDRALRTERGIRLRFAEKRDAYRFRWRLNKYRAADRHASRGLYPEGHEMHNRSVYDRLVFKVPPEGAELLILVAGLANLNIEEL